MSLLKNRCCYRRHPGFLPILLILFSGAAALLGKMRIFENVSVTNFPVDLQTNVDLHPIAAGFINVTCPPYSAVGDGVADDTAAIQHAIDEAYSNNLVVFFPGDKTYLCSRSLECHQAPVGNVVNRKFAHKLVGSILGQRPVLKLQDSAVLTSNLFIRFWYEGNYDEEAARHYCAEFKGINIDMGNNPDATALRMHGAQYCVIEDTEIYGDDFDIGIDGLPGSGGSVCNIAVTGGNIGIYQDYYRPNPSLAGIRLIGQSQYGIRVRSVRGPLIVSGFQIESPVAPAWAYRAVYARFSNAVGQDISLGNVVLVDGVIRMHGSQRYAIYNYDQDFYMENVYFDASVLIQSGMVDGTTDELPGAPAGQWERVRSYVCATGSDGSWVAGDSSVAMATNDIIEASVETNVLSPLDVGTNGTALVDSLISQHLYSSPFPSWEDTNLVWITVFGATPDDSSNDDAPAIQAALEATVDPHNPYCGDTVYIPRGHFHVKSPIRVPSGSRLIGAANTISVLQADTGWALTNVASIIETESDPTGSVLLANFAVLGHDPSPSKGTETQSLLRYATINTGNTLWRDIQFSQVNYYKDDNWQDQPVLLIQGNGGGKFYNFSEDNILFPDALAPGYPTEKFRVVEINGTTNPVRFYQMSIEHQGSGPAQVLIQNASNVQIYGFKYEMYHRLLDITDSRHIGIYGGSGNYWLAEAGDTSIVAVTNSFDVRIASLSRKPEPSLEQPGKLWLESNEVNLDDDSSIAFFSRDADYDLDELPDAWEIARTGNLTNLGQSGAAAYNANADEDQSSDYEEYIAGTDPTDPASYFLQTVSQLQLEWAAVSGRVYSVYGTADLRQPFSLIQDNLNYPQQNYAVPTIGSNRFFRIGVRLQ